MVIFGNSESTLCVTHTHAHTSHRYRYYDHAEGIFMSAQPGVGSVGDFEVQM